jgi:hypothetical protein
MLLKQEDPIILPKQFEEYLPPEPEPDISFKMDSLLEETRGMMQEHQQQYYQT